jgi:hypothetical protein
MLADKFFGKLFSSLNFKPKSIDKTRARQLIANKISEADRMDKSNGHIPHKIKDPSKINA